MVRFDFRSLPYQPFLIAAFIGISIYAPNRLYFPVGAMILPMCVLISLIVAILIILKYAQLNLNKGLIFISGVLLLNFTYYPVYDLLTWKWQIVSPATIIYTLLFFFLIYVVWKITHSQANDIAQILGIVAISLFIIGLANLGYSVISDAEEISDHGQEFENQFQRYLTEDLTSPLNNRDFYFIIVDAYRGKDTTLTELGVDNSDFIKSLESMGFIVLNGSRSNYGSTAKSIPSMLNMDYFDGDIISSLTVRHGYARYNEENNRLWRFFKSQGFKFILLSSNWYPTTKNDYADIVLNPYPIRLDGKSTFTIFQKIMFFERTFLGKLYYLLQNFIYNKVVPSDSIDAMQERIVRQEKDVLIEKLAEENHTRNTYDTLTNISQIPEKKFIFTHINDRSYIEELDTTNQRLETTLRHIITDSPQKPIIVVLSDHGAKPKAEVVERNREIYRKYASYPDGNLNQNDIYGSWYTLDNFMAFYLPDGGNEAIYSEMSPVNAWRTILNYYFNTKFLQLYDKHYWYWRGGTILEIEELQKSEMKLMPVFAEYTQSSIIYFGIGGNAEQYLMSGWCGPEEGFRWTNGHTAIFMCSLPKPETDLMLNLSLTPFLAGQMKNQRLSIWMNEHKLKDFSLTNRDITNLIVEIPRDYFEEEIQRIKFDLPDATSPNELGISADSRTLGVAFRTLSLNSSYKDASPPSYTPIFLGMGWHGLEEWGCTPTRWMKTDAILTIESEENHTAEMSFQAISFHRPRTLEMYLGDDSEVREVAVDSSKFATIEAQVHLKEGTNIIRFHVPEGCERPSDIPELKNPDGRCLSLAIRNITM